MTNHFGNSNWYIFCILYLYFITWVTFGLAAFSDSDKKTNQARSLFPLIIITLLTITYILQMMIMKGADAGHWYNTALCYPAGMFYAYFQKDIDQFLLYDHRKWLLVLITTVAIFLSFYQYKSNIWVYEICAISFALIVIWISMRFSMNSRVYYWLGKSLFGLFILQRLPMIYFESTGLAAEHTHIFIYICFVLMILLASIYNKVISIIRR